MARQIRGRLSQAQGDDAKRRFIVEPANSNVVLGRVAPCFRQDPDRNDASNGMKPHCHSLIGATRRLLDNVDASQDWVRQGEEARADYSALWSRTAIVLALRADSVAILGWHNTRQYLLHVDIGLEGCAT